jgi:hypothetical protein
VFPAAPPEIKKKFGKFLLAVCSVVLVSSSINMLERLPGADHTFINQIVNRTKKCQTIERSDSAGEFAREDELGHRLAAPPPTNRIDPQNGSRFGCE